MNASHLWQSPIHVVIAAPLQLLNKSTLAILMNFLSEEELERAGRFRREADQHRHILSHSLKRLCLSAVLAIDPLKLSFNLGDKGKPYCDNADAPDFNLSHSGDWVLLGLSSFGDIGVDVEVQEREVSDAVAAYALTPSQLEAVKQDPHPQQRFMMYWTQKEAISKALAMGLSIDFQTIDCHGSVARSVVKQGEHNLSINTLFLDDHIVSIASAHNDVPLLYRIVGWNGTPAIEQLELQVVESISSS